MMQFDVSTAGLVPTQPVIAVAIPCRAIADVFAEYSPRTQEQPAAPPPAGPPTNPTADAYGPDDTPAVNTVGELMDWYISRVPNTLQRDSRKERVRILRLFQNRFRFRSLQSLRAVDLVDFVGTQKRVKRNCTISRWYRTIKQAFHVAEQLGLIVRSPFKAVKVPRNDRGRDLTIEEFRQLVRSATPAYRRVLMFQRYTGARPGEMRRLTWENIDWKNRVAILREHKTSHTQRNPKPRSIYLCTIIVKMLLWMKRESRSNFVFVNSFGGQWKTRALCKNLQGIRAATGLPMDCKLYGCRHLHATELALSGADLATIATLLGHTNTQHTQTYVHVADKTDHLHTATEKAARRTPPPKEGQGETP